MDTVLVVDLIKGRLTPWPRLENDEVIMSTGSARPLEDAFRIAHGDLVHWLAEEHGLDALDAYQLVSQISESRSPTSATPTTRSWPRPPSATCPRATSTDRSRAGLVEVAGRYLGEQVGASPQAESSRGAPAAPSHRHPPRRGTVLGRRSHGRAGPRGRDRAPRRGPHNAITDVGGVSVGHATVVRDEPSVARTGVTAIWPHTGDPWRKRVRRHRDPERLRRADRHRSDQRVGAPPLTRRDHLEPRDRCGLRHDGQVDRRTRTGSGSLRRDHAGRHRVRRLVPQRRAGVPASPSDVVAALDGASRGEVAEGMRRGRNRDAMLRLQGGIGTVAWSPTRPAT